MSMLARYVQVTPEELDELLGEPSSAAELFDDEPVDPRLQDALTDRLETLGVGDSSGSGLLELMARRGLLQTNDEERSGQIDTTERRTLVLEKTWHGVHYLLCGDPEPQSEPEGRAVLGGTEVGDDEFGYGPARYFDAGDVAEIAAALDGGELAGEVESRFDPARMSALGIYPGRWQQSDRERLLGELEKLRDFLRDAAARGCAVVTCLV